MPIWYDLIFESILPTLLLHLVSIYHFESNFLFLFFFFFSFHLTIAQISPDSVEFFHVISYRLWNSNYFFFGNPVPLKITKAYIRLILKFVNGIIFRVFRFSRITKIRSFVSNNSCRSAELMETFNKKTSSRGGKWNQSLEERVERTRGKRIRCRDVDGYGQGNLRVYSREKLLSSGESLECEDLTSWRK